MKLNYKYLLPALLVLSIGSNCHKDSPNGFEPVSNFEEELTKCKKMHHPEDCDYYIIKEYPKPDKSRLRCLEKISTIQLSCFRQMINISRNKREFNGQDFYEACVHSHVQSVPDCDILHP